ncbi:MULTISPECIES: hypothetical protein [unclassified Erwinia]|uniref:hypothetical protein n=1 Tax=unclassified Erwinia TaxID=2622719 RepID=UPI000AC1F2F7|nr:hypothetical protein [Erwinia sp. ErVv1]
MQLRSANHHPQQSRKINETYCKAPSQDQVIIPESWQMTDTQRQFIEMMMDNENK